MSEVGVPEPQQRPASAIDAGLVVTDRESADRALATFAQHLRVADVEALRLLTLPTDPVVTTKELRITVERWDPVRSSWRGRPGPLAGLRGLQLSLQPGKHRAEAHVRLAAPLPVSDIVRAVLPALHPVGDLAGSGFPRLVVGANVPDAALALLPSRLPRRAAPFVETLEGRHLLPGDVALVGPMSPSTPRPQSNGELAGAEGGPLANCTLVLDDDGRITTAPRRPGAVLDLQVHNPTGRLAGWEPSAGSVAPRLVASRESLRVLRADGDVIVSAPLDRPLSAAAVRALRPWASASLDALEVKGRDHEAMVKRRLVELAATGLVLHDLAPGRLADDELVHRGLIDLMSAGYEPAVGLDRDARSVAQRRLAMRHHGGFLHLADAVQATTGHRLLPRVSVVVSSRRPARMVQVLRMLARQTYPHFEVVAVMHGVPTPDLAPYADELAGLDLRIVSEDPSTMFGAALAEGVRESRGDLVTKIDDDDWYSREHLWDLVLAWLYSGADIVGKTTEYLYFENVDKTVHRKFATETYHEQVAGGAMLLSRAALDATGGWRPTPNATDRSVLVNLYDAGCIAYRTHSLGYIYIRHAEGHTWDQQDAALARNSYEEWPHLRLPEVPTLADDELMRRVVER